jgi:AmiR/NasT family two-component response regulator
VAVILSRGIATPLGSQPGAVHHEHVTDTGHLKVAVDARKLIGQAMGILMERYSLDSDRAFEVLRRYSQDTNTKLHEVAQQLIDNRRPRV